MKYPTKKEILKLPRPIFKRGTLAIISAWKWAFYKGWNEMEMNAKLWHLQCLAEAICGLEGKPFIVTFNGATNKYHPIGFGIELKEPYSVISLLHELAHHLYGSNELTACRWSVWLYQLRFRKDYNKLIWQEHTLVKPSSTRIIKRYPSKKMKSDTTKSLVKQKTDGK